ncbi:MAG: segregation/condensation protein A [Bacilli bacterium]|nr:segregation/condensation protein A [Bacilli bacterium]
MIYNFSINDFEGPLDLLLHLIKINKMEIENVNVESITNQYMSFINEMKEKSIDIASEYLVMASELIHLKSKMLINIKEENDDEYEINSEEDLKEKLLEYEKIKEITNTFKDLENSRSEVYTKIPSDLSDYRTEVPLDSNITLNDLIEAFENFLNREKLKKPINTRITKKELSVGDRVKSIRKIFETKKKINFTELFEELNRPYIIVTFLSILEMSKNNEIGIKQENNFSEIILEKK